MSSKQPQHLDLRSGKNKLFSQALEVEVLSTPALKGRHKQLNTIVYEDNQSPKEIKDQPHPRLDYSPIQSVQETPFFKESVITQTDYENKHPPQIIPTFYGHQTKPPVKHQRQLVRRTQKLQSKMHFKTYEESNCTPKNNPISTNYSFSPNFEVEMFSSNMESAKSLKIQIQTYEEDKAGEDVYQRKINEIRRRVQAKLRDQSNRNSIGKGTQSLITPSNQQRKQYSQQFQHKQQDESPVIVIIEPNKNKPKLIAPLPPYPHKKTRNDQVQTRLYRQTLYGHPKTTSSFHDNQILPQRVKHLLHRLQHQFKSYHFEEHENMIDRVFKTRVLEENAFPSIKKHNESLKK